MNTATLQSITPDAEPEMIRMARVSNPSNQDNPSFERLLKYCLTKGHWSVFEMAHATFEITTSRAISAQIIRHRSFSFQEFSQRYADPADLDTTIPLPEIRLQHDTNRQASVEATNPAMINHLQFLMDSHFKDCQALYESMISQGVAKETARFVLPMASPTRLYMSGSIRSWIHYIAARTYEGTQKEHRLIAEDIRDQLAIQMPVLASAAGWA